MQKPDEDNIIFKTAANFINNSNHPVFLTGKAGTGKTTFLKYIKDNTRKNTVVVAPTGVSAINAGGTTIHSFFQLPFAPYIPVTKKQFGIQTNFADKNSLLGSLKLSAERREVMECLELLVIDEISMVRCDVLDAIDAVLRYFRRRPAKPFGGVQLLYIGDMYQLPPVKKEEEWKLLSPFYDNEYFFSSQVICEQSPVYIELKKIYRQSDTVFINLLNKVRNNEMEEESYNLLHSRYLPDYKTGNTENFITLTTHNSKADIINIEALSKINERTFSFNASIIGAFYDNSFPAEEVLNLKVGAQVMFLKNDMEKMKRYYNGKIGIIQKIEDDKIWVECRQDDFSQLIEVKKETWRNIRYAINNKTKQIEEEELGSFTQYPLRLAWAITIHKSQGLTFQNAIIDAGMAFAPGQVYVALSRCTSLDGIILRSKISYGSLHSDERIVDFATKQQSSKLQEQMLFNATKQYQQDIILSLFDFTGIETIINDLLAWIKENNYFGQGVWEWLVSVKTRFAGFNNYSEKFQHELKGFFTQDSLPEETELFQERFKKAAGWFSTEIEKTKTLVSKSPAITDNRQLAKDYSVKLQKIFDMICYQAFLLNNLKNGFSLTHYSEQKAVFKKELFAVSAYSGKSAYVPVEILHPELYNTLKDKRNEIAARKNVAVFFVCNSQSLEEMAMYLPVTLDQLGKINGFGSVKLKQFGNDFINIIKSYCEEHNLDNSNIRTIEKKVKKLKSESSNKPDTKKISFELYKSGKSVSEIAAERNLAGSTIETHLAHFIENGNLDINSLVKGEIQQLIIDMLNKSENKSLTLLKEQLPSVTYGELKWVIASEKSKMEKFNSVSPSEIIL